MNHADFVNYVLDFYGYQGVYDYCFTQEEVEAALKIHLRSYPEFFGDSLDRERVRDVVFKQRGQVVDN